MLLLKGVRVILVDKSYCGMSGATAPSGTGVWYVPPDPEQREAAMATGAGAEMSGMEFSNAYARLPAFSSVTKGTYYR